MGEKEPRIIDPTKEWSSEYSIIFLPRPIRETFRERADILYSDLSKNHLEVALVPAPDPKHPDHMIRVAISQNPSWYQELNRTEPSRIRRPHSLRALDRIRHVRDPQLSPGPAWATWQKYAYTALYREVIFEMLVFGYKDRGIYVTPEKKVQEFFEIEGIEEVLEPPF